jgi:deazaflavin-dependent oxidoreductase (nitroreductase family)
VIASKGGTPTNPDWYHNVAANPAVTVEAETGSGVERFEARATIAEAEERQRLFDAQAKVMRVSPTTSARRRGRFPVVIL